jgi:integrase
MTITKRGKSFIVSVGSFERRYRQSFKTLKEAEIAELEAQLRFKATGSPLVTPTWPSKPEGQGHTLREAHDLAWRLIWSQHKPAGQKTHQVFCRAVFREIPWQTPLKDISFDTVLEAVEAWEEDGNGGQTVNHKVTHLSTMLDVALDKGWIDGKPKMIRRRPGKHRLRWFSEAEEFKMLNLCAHLEMHELRDFIVVAIDTGFRRGELLGLRPNDFVNGMLHLHEGETKTDKARAVPVTDRAAEVLHRRSTGTRIFSFTRSSLRYHWMNLKTAMGLDDDNQFLVHTLRHTCASRLVQRGTSLAVVQVWMGHSSIVTTQRYWHLRPDSLMEGKRALEQVFEEPRLRVVNN